MKNLHVLPDNLPVPVDDGACVHLTGIRFPSVALMSSARNEVDISLIPGLVVVYFYPMIGKPDSPPMLGWNEIPGARGCTPQSCAFRDLYGELTALGVKVYGASSQATAAQQEAATRLHLPFELLSDSSFQLTQALKLPTFEYQSAVLIKRLTLIIDNGVIVKTFYPVFPPNENATQVVAWLKQHAV